ncbi:MAG TPA: hypothetical protein PK743_01820 [Luteimonas sp.]|nr:hypothetical protein [Luteimonas sp.]HRO28587.1 hypothetical protein [Luteimonas sp.]HRP71358.1 hypothetical protein [Luteimonas sp.]
MKAEEFPLAPLARAPWMWLLLPALAIVAGAWLLPQQPQDTPAPQWLAAPFMVALVLVAPLLALRRRRIAIEGRELVVAATFYTRRVSVDALDLDHARVADLAEHTGYAPMLGLNRFGLPGFRAGHYLLRNRQRAFCLLTARDRVLVLPQRDGKVLLLSPAKPRELLERLRELAAPTARR